jgi:hypothetical protein
MHTTLGLLMLVAGSACWAAPSMATAILTGVALRCYLANLLVVGPPTTPGSER